MNTNCKLRIQIVMLVAATATVCAAGQSTATSAELYADATTSARPETVPPPGRPAVKPIVPGAKPSATQPANIDAATNTKNPSRTDWEPIPSKTFSAARRAQECAKYEGKMISYYDDIYHVEKCKRRLIANVDLTHQITSKYAVKQVGNDTIIMLAEGKPIDTLDSKFASASKSELCHMLEGGYITIAGDDIYLVDKCKRHLFPDWETFEAHKKKSQKEYITELTPAEVNLIPEGKEIPSIMPDVFKKLLKGSHEADVIPIDEACRGLNGKYVSYYSHVYFIEKCRKREVDPEDFLNKHKNEKVTLVELSSEQWLSLPDGKTLSVNDKDNPSKSR